MLVTEWVMESGLILTSRSGTTAAPTAMVEEAGVLTDLTGTVAADGWQWDRVIAINALVDELARTISG
jgi:hypothetical protein